MAPGANFYPGYLTYDFIVFLTRDYSDHTAEEEFYNSNHPPPINSLRIELGGILIEGRALK